MNPLWMPKMRSYFITCSFQHFIGPIEVIFQKNVEDFEKWIKSNLTIATTKGAFGKKKLKKLRKHFFPKRKHAFST